MSIALLALKVTRVFEKRLHRAFRTTDQDSHTLTLEDALTALSRITYLYYPIKDKTAARLPRPDAIQSEILSALGISFPTTAAYAISPIAKKEAPPDTGPRACGYRPGPMHRRFARPEVYRRAFRAR